MWDRNDYKNYTDYIEILKKYKINKKEQRFNELISLLKEIYGDDLYQILEEKFDDVLTAKEYGLI